MRSSSHLIPLLFLIGTGACSTGAALAPAANRSTATSVLIAHDTQGAECFLRLHSTDATVGRSFRVDLKPGAPYAWAAVPPGDYEMRGIACYDSFENPQAVAKRITISQDRVNYLGGLFIGEKAIRVTGSDPASLTRLRTAFGDLGPRANAVVSGFSKTPITAEMAREKIAINVNFVVKEGKQARNQAEAKSTAQQNLRGEVQKCLNTEESRNLVLLGDYHMKADYSSQPPRIDPVPTGQNTLGEAFTYCIVQALRLFSPPPATQTQIAISTR